MNIVRTVFRSTICIEDEEKSPERTEEGQRLPPPAANHSVELNNSQKGSNSHYYGKPGVTKPDGSEEDRYEDYCA